MNTQSACNLRLITGGAAASAFIILITKNQPATIKTAVTAETANLMTDIYLMTSCCNHKLYVVWLLLLFFFLA